MSITNLYKNDALVFQRSRSGYNFDFGKCIERALISEKEHLLSRSSNIFPLPIKLLLTQFHIMKKNNDEKTNVIG